MSLRRTRRLARMLSASGAILVLPVLGLAANASASGVSHASPPKWLAQINYYRTSAGLTPAKNNPAWDTGIRNHLKYLAKTPPKYLTGQYASAHTENPKSPYYTKSGALEASRSDLIPGGFTGTPLDAVNIWLEAPLHAIGMLRDGLGSVALAVGYGGAGLDVLGGLVQTTPSSPILFPGKASKTALASYGGEAPDPTQGCHWAKAAASKPRGLPLIVMLPRTPAKGASASLTTPSGKVESTKAKTLCLIDQYTYRSTDTVYGPTGLAILKQANAVLLFPDTVLTKGRYHVSLMGAQSTSVKWSFTETG